MDTLLLNADYKPKAVVNWQKAIEYKLRDVVYVLAEYDGWLIRSASAAFTVPAVLMLKKYVHRHKRVNFCRTNLYIRDNFTCQYCGDCVKDGDLRVRDLTYDHVLPRSRGGLTTWQNIVAACRPCNRVKGDRLPKEAKMPLLQKPYEPSNLNNVEFGLIGREVPEIWKDFLTDDALSLTA